MSIPAIAALNRLANVAATIARKPISAISCLLEGAIPPNPPIIRAIAPRLANPQSAKLIITTLFGDRLAISGAKAV